MLSPTEATFASFNLPTILAETLAEMGYTEPTPVQARAIPFALQGRDVLATAQTGTGKTAAFAIPLLNAMLTGRRAPALILAPTRELAEQTAKVLQQLTARTPQLKTVVIIGGSSYQYQTRGLKNKPAFVVGTPGRLIDQMGLGNLKLGTFGALVLDEADRMLDMGFAPQLEQLISQMPEERHTMLFSATLPNEIKSLAARYLNNPERIAIGDVSTPVDRIKQEVIEVENKHKGERLLNEIDKVAGSLIIFTRTKTRVEQVTKLLNQAGHQVARIHGDRSQRQRGEAIREFRDGQARILVATDIAARGIDIPHIKYVVNFDLPLCPEDYIHRIGRTARAGADGTAWAFVTPEETFLWARIYKMMYGKYPEGWDRRRSGGNRTANQRPMARGRGQDRFGGGRSSYASDRQGAFGAGRGASTRPSFGADRPGSSRPAFGGDRQTGMSSSRPAFTAPRAEAPRASLVRQDVRPVLAPANSRPRPLTTAGEARPIAKQERSSFEKAVVKNFEQRALPTAAPTASFAAEILASAEAANKNSEAPAGMNRAARRALKFSEDHRVQKAREGNRNEDSVIRASTPTRNTDAVSTRPARAGFGGSGTRRDSSSARARPRTSAFGGGERREAPKSERTSEPTSDRSSARGSRPSFGGPSGGERPSSRPSFGGRETGRPSAASRPFGARKDLPGRPAKSFDRPARSESLRGERPPTKRGRFAERLNEMLGQ